MPFHYQNDLKALQNATIDYWQRLTFEARERPARKSDIYAEKIKPRNDRTCAAVEGSCRLFSLPVVAINAGDWNTSSVKNAFPDRDGKLAFIQVKETTDLKHAEMKILDFFSTKAPVNKPEYIGISKPCCLRCAVVLIIAGIGFRGTSGGLWNAGWKIPRFISENEERKRMFVGDEEALFKGNDGKPYKVLEVYDDMTPRRKEEYLLSLQDVRFRW